MAKGLEPIIESVRRTLMDSKHELERLELEGVTKAKAHVISHGSSNMDDRVGSGAIGRGDRDTFEFDSVHCAIGQGDGSRNARAAREKGKEGLEREDESCGSYRVTLTNPVPEGNRAAHVPIHLDAGGSVSEEKGEEVTKGSRKPHLGHNTHEIALIDAIKRFESICEKKEAREVEVVSIVFKVLHEAAVGEARFTFLARDLTVANDPRQGGPQGIRDAACKNLVENGADRDWSIVREEMAGAFLVNEGGDRDVPVSGEGGVLSGQALMIAVNEELDDTSSLRTLGCTRGIIIIIIKVAEWVIIVRSGVRFTQDKETEEFSGEAV